MGSSMSDKPTMVGTHHAGSCNHNILKETRKNYLTFI